MSSGDEDSKDQQVCETSTWLPFSLQTGGTTTHYSHDKGTLKGGIFPRAAMRFNRRASTRTNVFVPFVLAPRPTARRLQTGRTLVRRCCRTRPAACHGWMIGVS